MSVPLSFVILLTSTIHTPPSLLPFHQDRRKQTWRTRISRSTSLKKRSMVGTGSELEEMGALLSWLCEQTMEKVCGGDHFCCCHSPFSPLVIFKTPSFSLWFLVLNPFM